MPWNQSGNTSEPKFHCGNAKTLRVLTNDELRQFSWTVFSELCETIVGRGWVIAAMDGSYIGLDLRSCDSVPLPTQIVRTPGCWKPAFASIRAF